MFCIRPGQWYVNLSTKMSYFTIKWDAHDNLIKYKFKKNKGMMNFWQYTNKNNFVICFLAFYVREVKPGVPGWPWSVATVITLLSKLVLVNFPTSLSLTKQTSPTKYKLNSTPMYNRNKSIIPEQSLDISNGK